MGIKSLFVVSFAFCLAPGFVHAAELQLKAEKEELIVDILNDACADSWCEGPVEIKFETVNYDSGSGTYVIGASTVRDEKNIFAKKAREFKCVVKDSSIIKVIVNSTDLYDAKTSEAQEKLLALVDRCVDQQVTTKL